MIYVCLALVAALVVSTLADRKLLLSERRAHARERDLLVNQLLHAAGNPWQQAPADEKPPPAPPRDLEPKRFVPNIGRFPAE